MLRVNHLEEVSCYFNVQHRDHVAAMMFGQAYRLFKDASIIKLLPKLKHLYKKSSPLDLSKIHNLASKMDMPILDANRIGTAFEIILKAELLRRGYVIHEHKDRHLRKKQCGTPIKIEDIKKAEKITRRKSNNFSIESLKTRTIKLSSILKSDKYRHVINYPSKIYPILDRINRVRNSLHFLPVFGRTISDEILDEYACLRTSINKRVIKSHNSVMKKMNFKNFILKPI